VGEGRQSRVREWEEKGGGTEWEKRRLNESARGEKDGLWGWEAKDEESGSEEGGRARSRQSAKRFSGRWSGG
jgi:hypothetical protein